METHQRGTYSVIIVTKSQQVVCLLLVWRRRVMKCEFWITNFLFLVFIFTVKLNTRPALARPRCQTLIEAKIQVQKRAPCQESDGERAKHEEEQREGLVTDAALETQK